MADIADLEALAARINKKLGDDEAVILGSDINYQEIPRVTSGILSLDVALGGGWPTNQWNEVYGEESCLDGNTFIPFQVRSADGKLVNSKGGTLSRLWERMHGEKQHHLQRDDVEFWVASVNDEDRIQVNRIIDVVRTGTRECFEVITAQGHTLTATAEHRFYTGEGFTRLKDLHPGDVVMIHNSTPYRADQVYDRKTGNTYVYRKYLFVRTHGVAGVKEVYDRKTGNTYVYHRLAKSRAVVEAHLNGLDLDTYVDRLNSGDVEGLSFLPRDLHVHHLDEDFTNDSLPNLVVMTSSQHGREHALERHNNLRFVAVEDRVVSVTPVGERVTYDVKMSAPFNNYVAQNFIVHNSGKTATILRTIAANQERDEHWTVLWIAAEEFVPSYAEMIGVDLKRVVVVNTNIMELAYDVVCEYMDARAVDCVVIDSLPALTPTAEGEDAMEKFHVGLGARLTGQFFRKVRKSGKRSLVTEDRPVLGLMVNQFREKIGVMYGDNRTTPGGKAKNFAYFTRVEVRRDEWLENDAKGKDKLRIGQSIKARTVKNKSAPGQRIASYDFYFDAGGPVPAGQIDTVKDVFTTASQFDIVTRKGPYYYFGEHQWQGRSAAADALREDPDLLAEVSAEVMKVLKEGH